MKKRFPLAGLAAALIAFCAPVQAQADYPSRPIRLIVPFPAGGSTDVVARLIAERLGQKFGQQVVVDNRPGAGGNIGTDQAVKAAPDGYTLVLSTSGPLANNKFLYENMPFDAEKDVTPIALVGEIPLVVVVNEKSPHQSFAALTQAAKSANKPMSFGNPGNGTIGHLAFELWNHQSSGTMQAIPYRGDMPAMTDLMGNSIDGIVAPITAFISNIQAGKLKGLAVMSAERFPGTPDVPTAKEQGADLQASVWFAIAGPKGMPAPVVQKLNQEINAITRSSEGRDKLAQFGAVARNGTPEDLGTLMKEEAAKWQQVIERANIKLN